MQHASMHIKRATIQPSCASRLRHAVAAKPACAVQQSAPEQTRYMRAKHASAVPACCQHSTGCISWDCVERIALKLLLTRHVSPVPVMGLSRKSSSMSSLACDAELSAAAIAWAPSSDMWFPERSTEVTLVLFLRASSSCRQSVGHMWAAAGNLTRHICVATGGRFIPDRPAGMQRQLIMQSVHAGRMHDLQAAYLLCLGVVYVAFWQLDPHVITTAHRLHG